MRDQGIRQNKAYAGRFLQCDSFSGTLINRPIRLETLEYRLPGRHHGSKGVSMIKLKPELFAALDTRDGLLNGLQQAIQLEHATIPTYLYPLYSIKLDSNTEIQDLIRSIVIQEMLHMGLVCNILNAIGGSPVINRPEFVPQYPGPLPGAVESELIVPLARFSLDLIKNVFMVIEEPETPLNFPVRAFAAAPPQTI